MKDSKTLRYVACGCLFLSAVFNSIFNIATGPVFYSTYLTIAILISTIGLIASMAVLTLIGSSASVILSGYYLYRNLRAYDYFRVANYERDGFLGRLSHYISEAEEWVHAGHVLCSFYALVFALLVIISALIIVANVKKEKADILGKAISGFSAAGFIVSIVFPLSPRADAWFTYAFRVSSINSFFVLCLLFVGFFLIGLCLDDIVNAPKVKKAAKAAPPSTEDVVTRLTELRGLLDRGVITNEEFEAKKQEILNSQK